MSGERGEERKEEIERSRFIPAQSGVTILRRFAQGCLDTSPRLSIPLTPFQRKVGPWLGLGST